MQYHLNWDENQGNGIIFNKKYQTGCLFVGIEHRPALSFKYSDFQYSEVFDSENHVITEQGQKRAMTSDEQSEVRALAIKWIQPLGQEGNPTDEQKMEFIRHERNNLLKATDHLALTDGTLSDEMVIYRQALRNLTENIDINNPVYPVKP